MMEMFGRVGSRYMGEGFMRGLGQEEHTWVVAMIAGIIDHQVAWEEGDWGMEELSRYRVTEGWKERKEWELRQEVMCMIREMVEDILTDIDSSGTEG